MANNDNLDFSNRLKTLRIKTGLKQKEVADAIGLTSATYNRYEKGTSNPTVGNSLKMAKFFDVSPEYLMMGVSSDNDTNMTVGERIKKIREQKGIKQYELAKKAEISVNALINYEKNKRNPPLRAVDKIALALDVTPFYLMYGENDPMLSITKVVKEFNNSTELINQKIDMLLKAFDINNIKYEISKQTHNYVLEVKIFLNEEFFTLDTDELIYIYDSAYNIFNNSVKNIIELIENYKKGD